MSEVQTGGRASGVIRGKSGDAVALRAADWLGLAAAPAFAIMARLTAMHDGPADILCSAAHDASLLHGMSLMYASMSFFHSAPWLKLVIKKPA
jgi:hypothetical protein